MGICARLHYIRRKCFPGPCERVLVFIQLYYMQICTDSHITPEVTRHSDMELYSPLITPHRSETHLRTLHRIAQLECRVQESHMRH